MIIAHSAPRACNFCKLRVGFSSAYFLRPLDKSPRSDKNRGTNWGCPADGFAVRVAGLFFAKHARRVPVKFLSKISCFSPQSIQNMLYYQNARQSWRRTFIAETHRLRFFALLQNHFFNSSEVDTFFSVKK